MNNVKQPFFTDSEVISAYSRNEALEDGVLIDVSEMAREAGFRLPVAITEALWADIEAISERFTWQEVKGRLWDVLWMGIQAVRSSKVGGDTLVYGLHLPVGATTEYQVKLVCGPGDDAEPVITLMRPDED
jgi:hypothetical protein